MPGLVGMVLLFNGMQSSLAMVYDREMGLMRLLLTGAAAAPWLLLSKLVRDRAAVGAAGAGLRAGGAAAGTELPLLGRGPRCTPWWRCWPAR